MNKTNRNASLALWAVLPLCLTLASLSKPAAAEAHGIANGLVSCDPANDTCSSYTPLPVGPGGGGSPINPNDAGMCGLLHISGTFDNSAAALIVVRDGYYAVYKAWSASNTSPNIEWTCVRFTEFSGLPPISDLQVFIGPLVSASGGGSDSKGVGGAGSACIWAGVMGALRSKDQQAIVASAQYNAADTLELVQSDAGTTLQSYAYCSAFKGFSWGNYRNGVAITPYHSTSMPVVPLHLTPGQVWCYMDAVGATPGDMFTTGGLSFVSGEYAFSVGPGSLMQLNCLRLSQ
jgi:hypothetical protein